MTVTVSGHYVRADCPKCEGTGRTTWRGLPAYCEACDPTAPVVPVAVIERAELMPGVDPTDREWGSLARYLCDTCECPLLDGDYWDVTEATGWTRHHEDCWTPDEGEQG